MNKFTRLINKIKKYGVLDSILFLFESMGYFISKPFYLFYLQHFAQVDKNQILLMSAPNYSGNAKALYDYLRRNEAEYHFVWLFDKEGDIPSDTEDTKFIRRRVHLHYGFTLSSLKKVATSKYLFFTHRSPVHEIRKKPNQIVINLWHGCGYKAVEKSKTSWIKDNPFDYALVPGKLFIPTKAKFWGCKEEQILPIGYPRYDYLISNNENGKTFIEDLKETANKIIIWMPTFRNTDAADYPEAKINYAFDIPLMKNLDELIQLDEICKELQVSLCIKRHIYQLRYSCEDHVFRNIKFISNDDLAEANVELYSILRYTDALISDYSSVAIDYLLLDKPIAFCLEDFEEYKNTRGFVFEDPLEYMPGHHLYEFEDMKNFIEDVCAGRDQYREQRAKVRAVAQNPCDNYCERVWKTVQHLEKSNINI